jgi:hypothetical protein
MNDSTTKTRNGGAVTNSASPHLIMQKQADPKVATHVELNLVFTILLQITKPPTLPLCHISPDPNCAAATAAPATEYRKLHSSLQMWAQIGKNTCKNMGAIKYVCFRDIA